MVRKREMLKLFCMTGYKTHEGDPIINGHQSREMIPEEADVSSDDVQRLKIAIDRLRNLVANVYRINAAKDAAQEYHVSLASLNSDNIEAMLTLDRKLRSYVIEYDMFLDYWEAYIAHHKRIDGSSDEQLIIEYKKLFGDLTHKNYDEHVEYQLLDMIRNQTAHVQSPVNHIHIGVDGNEAFSCRDVLLSKCKSGENKKRILHNQPEEIALSPIVDVTVKCLQEIHDGLIDFQIDDLVAEECKYISGFISYAISKNHLFEPWLIIDTKSKLSYHINNMKAYGYILGRLSKTSTIR